MKPYNQNNVKQVTDINKQKDITKSNNINKSNQEKINQIINKENSNKNINNKMTQIKPNLISKHSSNPEKNRLNSNQKLKSKQPIISQKNNFSDKNNLSQKNFKRPDNLKPLSHKINQNPIKNNNNSSNKISHYSNNNSNLHINKDKTKINNNHNKIHNSEETKIDRIKKALENRRADYDGKHIYPEKIKNSYYYNNNIKPKYIRTKRDFFEGSDYDESDSFIDDSNYKKDDAHKEVMAVLNNFKAYQDMKKKTEFKGDIMVSNYDRIQEEEERTRRIGKKEDLEALIENREREDSQEESDEEDEY